MLTKVSSTYDAGNSMRNAQHLSHADYNIIHTIQTHTHTHTHTHAHTHMSVEVLKIGSVDAAIVSLVCMVVDISLFRTVVARSGGRYLQR